MNARRLLRICGLAISVAAVIWIGVRFVDGGAIDLLARLPVNRVALIAALAAGAVLYAFAMCFPGLAWWRLVATLAPQAPPLRQTVATYAVSQYGKYLPGNVAHYALRHAWSRRYGVPHASLGLASILEAVLLLLAALGATLMADSERLRTLSRLDPRVGIALLVGALVVLWIALAWIRRHEAFSHLHVPPLPPSMLAICIACYLAFFVLCALLLFGLARVLGIADASFAMLLAAGAASWLAGFVVVGAPAGLGVREAVFAALTGAALGESSALLLIGLFRAVTFLGDTLFLAVGAAVSREPPLAPPATSG